MSQSVYGYRIEFMDVGADRLSWVTHLKEFSGPVITKHLAQQGIDLAVAGEEPFSLWPADDDSGVVEGRISEQGRVIGRIRATPLSKSTFEADREAVTHA